MVTQDDSGKTISISPGEYLYVELDGSTSDPWGKQNDSNQTALTPKQSKTGNGDMWVAYLASTQGQATITATETPTCTTASPPCEQPDRQFTLTVDVK